MVAEQKRQETRVDTPRQRRVWPAEEKRRIVAESFAPGASVSVVARRYDVNANLLFTWRRRFGAVASLSAGEGLSFVPAISADPGSSATSVRAGQMEIVLASGDRVIVGADVDTAALARVVKVLSRQ